MERILPGPTPTSPPPCGLSLPFIDERLDGERDRTAEHTRADLYRGSLDRNGNQIAIAVGAVASSAEGAVVVHCLSGVDHTGRAWWTLCG
ncbi:tyrosine-protein phosphatase [Actinopolymorpha sp. NPDC004070]|uniref:tyrosine-protein phosphatase n=1 Tax=Actinopolymorpha sp. NPDC004070 TaxID=3154548 RepID=UPI0033BC180E